MIFQAVILYWELIMDFIGILMSLVVQMQLAGPARIFAIFEFICR